MPERILLTVDVGPNAPVEVVREVIDSIDTLCQFADQLGFATYAREEWDARRSEARANRMANVAAELVERTSAPTRVAKRSAQSPSKATAKKARKQPPAAAAKKAPKAARRTMRVDAPRGLTIANVLDLESTTTVERMKYENPLEIVLAGGAMLMLVWGVVVELPRVVRDWKTDRRKGEAEARIREAEAEDAENIVRARKMLRNHAVRQLIASGAPFNPEQVTSLFTPQVASATASLAKRDLDMKILDASIGDDPNDES